jgi:UDP-N-acetylglucosamine 1-carboxyvinyltransferase
MSLDSIRITGGVPLHGAIRVEGAKNAALPLMAASLLTADTLALYNVPHLMDIVTMSRLLLNHGVHVSFGSVPSENEQYRRVLMLSAKDITSYAAPYDIVRKMRASVLVLGPLLARFGEAVVSLPGGCAIGTRPINYHLEALEQMGAKIELRDGYVHASCKGRLKGAEIVFDTVSVGATENIMMAATLAKGKTVLMNAAREPEITDLAHCLQAMGAQIEGIGTSTLEIYGTDALHGAYHRVIPDRIEAGTYAIAAAMTGGEIVLRDVSMVHIDNIVDKLAHAGVVIQPHPEGVLVCRNSGIHAADMSTQAYPGFPTDMQAQYMTLMSIAPGGTAVITENVFENRYMHVSELNRLGANIQVNGNVAVVRGVDKLRGAEVMATDLRASVSLVIAGLAAEGATTINRVYHIDRGYERIEEKLLACGARIERLR